MNKKVLLIVALVLVVGGVVMMGGKTGAPGGTTSTASKGNKVKETGSNPGQEAGSLKPPAETGTGTAPKAVAEDEDEDDLDLDFDVQAADKYKSAEEALAAIKKGAEDYDDFILQQFVEPGENCTWCAEFYNTVRNMALDPSIDIDKRGYYGELLAISGKPENISLLVEGIQNAKTDDDKDMFAESLELAIGGDAMLNSLSPHMKSGNETLREAAVAAVSNQGSRLAAELLYKDSVDRDDANGYYDIGIGLGELVPDDETLPYLQGLVQQRDKFSHLAVKSLMNSGLPGLTLVFNTLSTNPQAADSALLADANDHLIFEEEIKEYLDKTVKESKVPAVVDFAKKVLEEFAEEESDFDEEDEDE